METNIQRTLETALKQGQSVLYKGSVASYIPELAKADSSNLGVCLMTGCKTYSAGDCNIPFTMQSISKTCALILALQTSGYTTVFGKVGMEPTGDRFDSILQLELKDRRPFNPMINAGAIVTTSCITGDHPFERFLTLVRKLCGNDDIYLNENVYQSEKLTGTRNRSIAYLLTSEGVLNGDPESTLDLYFRMCSVMVTAKDLAHYALVLSCKGTDPFTGEQIVSPDIVQTVITLMLLCGMYDESGEYAVRVGMPSKSGVGGGIIAVGRDGIGIGTFGPMLNQIGNSVGGKKIIQHLSENLGLHMFSK